MGEFIFQVLAGAPIWVWPLLVVLVVMGVRASKRRSMPVFVLFILPFLGLMTLRNVGALPHVEIAYAGFGLGFLAGAALGHRLQSGWNLSHEGGRVLLEGEWLTLIALMVIFWTNFAGGTLRAVAPEVLASPVFSAVFAGALGAVAGSFLGRSVSTLRFVWGQRQDCPFQASLLHS